MIKKYMDIKIYKKYGESLKSIHYGSIHQIPIQKSIIKYFPGYDLNETIIEQLVKILLKIQEYTGYTSE